MASGQTRALRDGQFGSLAEASESVAGVQAFAAPVTAPTPASCPRTQVAPCPASYCQGPSLNKHPAEEELLTQNFSAGTAFKVLSLLPLPCSTFHSIYHHLTYYFSPVSVPYTWRLGVLKSCLGKNIQVTERGSSLAEQMATNIG